MNTITSHSHGKNYSRPVTANEATQGVIKTYIDDLMKIFTLDEVANQSSVSKWQLKMYRQGIVQPKFKNFKRIVRLWMGVCNG